MPVTPDAIRAAVEQRFAQVASSPELEKKFPVGLASAKQLGYDPQGIDAVPPSATESFCGVGNPLGLGKAPDDVSGPFFTDLPVENARTSWYTTVALKPVSTPARNQHHERSEPDRRVRTGGSPNRPG